jgi:DNA invertase Pin-like site-specific DNA recombinase
MQDIDSGKIDIVVVYKIDRFSRSLLDFATVMGRLSKRGVGLVSVTQNFSTTNAMGRLTLNMLMSFAEYEREMIAERTRDKIGAARRRGKWTGGMPPLGYNTVNGKLVVAEDEALIVREIFDDYVENHSLLRVVEGLRERRRTTKTYLSKTGNMRRAKAWTKGSVLRILKNPVLAGLIHNDGTYFPSEHQAIIPEAQFNQVKAMLAQAPSQCTPAVRNPLYLLRGVLRCSRCDAAMTPGSTQKGDREYRYYRCMTREKQGSGVCAAPSLPAREVEELVLKYIRAFAKRKDSIAEVQRLVDERVEKSMACIVPKRKELAEQIARASARVRTISEDLEAPSGKKAHARKALLERLDQAALGLHELQKELSALEAEAYALESAGSEVDWVAGILREFDQMWKLLTPENQGKLVCSLVEKVTVDDKTGAVSVELAVLSEPLPCEVEI